MKIIEFTHNRFAYGRRLERLRDHFANSIEQNSHVLDVGCGDGKLALSIMETRPDLTIDGIDVLVRPETHIPVASFDGTSIPYPDASFDVVMLSDVLHHASDPYRLLTEAARVSRRTILIKDHTRDGFLAGPTLRLMDWVGNARHGVALPYNYWLKNEWFNAFRKLGLSVREWKGDLSLYPGWADLVFGRSLHFLTKLNVSISTLQRD